MIKLSNLENDIFNYLYEKKGTVCSAEELSYYIYDTYERTSTIRVTLHRIRKKIEKNIDIRVIYKKGYIID